ncbi:BQ2448_1420 [Microbotryum intermedium]|uniref:Anaphase-promoting complex subunit 5 n=1 Tax=Microbotryum intermedium TaxID=269621 RepID=A0A238FG66_9BASI|nr:BQ2448_1420 [Microbotryum intermedium]
MPPSTPPLHPSQIPTLILITLLPTTLLTCPIQDSILELCLLCIYEADPPQRLKEWVKRIGDDGGLGLGQKVSNVFEQELKNVVLESTLALARNGLDMFHSWLQELKRLYPSTEEDEASLTNTILHRLSPLALYIRRFRLTFSQLSFDQAVEWWEDVRRWCGLSHTTRGKKRIVERQRTRREVVAQSYRDARACADYQGMKDALAFYDLGDGSGGVMKGRPQTALLNLAFLEYEHQGYIAAREALNEAIQVARNAGDSQCLATAASFKARLDSASPSTQHLSTTLTTSNPTPTDLLHTLTDLTLHSTTPLPSLFTLLYASRTAYQIPPPPKVSLSGLKPHNGGPQPNPKLSPLSELLGMCEEVEGGEEADLWEAQMGVVGAELWRQLGSTNLSHVGEELALEGLDRHAASSRVDPTTEWDLRIAILCRQSQRLARSNQIAQALTLLLSAVDTRSKRSSMGLPQFLEWENLIWEIIRIEAHRTHDLPTLDLLSKIQPTSSKTPFPTELDRSNDSNPTSGTTTTTTTTTTKEMTLPQLHSTLFTSLNLIESDCPTLALNPTLNALYSARKQGRATMGLVALVRLVELRIRISPSRQEAERGVRDLEGLWDKFLRCFDESGGEGEVLGLGWETKGRLEVLKGTREGEGKIQAISLFKAIKALDRALQVYENLDLPLSIKRVLVLLVHIYDHLSQTVDSKYNRDKERYASRVLSMNSGEGSGTKRSLDGLVDVLELVREAVVGKVVA